MAAIEKRYRKDGSFVYRVRLRRNDFPGFTISFETQDEAVNWVLKHEDSYYDDPQKYHDWMKKILRVSKQLKTRKERIKDEPT